MWHHLAQFNLARIRAPLDDPLMTDYARAIPIVNELATRSPGFVWRSLEMAPILSYSPRCRSGRAPLTYAPSSIRAATSKS